MNFRLILLAPQLIITCTSNTTPIECQLSAEFVLFKLCGSFSERPTRSHKATPGRALGVQSKSAQIITSNAAVTMPQSL